METLTLPESVKVDKRKIKRPSLRSRKERDELVRQWDGIPTFVTKKYKGLIRKLRIEQEDAYQACWIGLLRAAELYDPSKEIAFSSYAIICCRNSILSLLDRGGRLIHVPAQHSWSSHPFEPYIHQARRIVNLNGQDVGLVDKRSMRNKKTIDIETPFAYEWYNDLEVKELWEGVYKGLRDRWKEIIRMYYQEGIPAVEVAAKLRVSRQRVFQILDVVLIKLLNKLGDDWDDTR